MNFWEGRKVLIAAKKIPISKVSDEHQTCSRDNMNRESKLETWSGDYTPFLIVYRNYYFFFQKEGGERKSIGE